MTIQEELLEIADEFYRAYSPPRLCEKLRTLASRMTVEGDIGAYVKFLHDASRYFKNRDTGGEDLAHWSNVFNAENCEKIATALQSLSERVKELEAETQGKSFQAFVSAKRRAEEAEARVKELEAALMPYVTILRTRLDDAGKFDPANDADFFANLNTHRRELERYEALLALTPKEQSNG